MRLGIELLVAVALVVLFGLVSIGFLANAVGAHLHHGASRAGQAVSAVVCLGLLFLSSRWAVHVEHRLRHHQPVAQAFNAKHVAAGPRAGPTRTGSTRSRPTRPVRSRRRDYAPATSAAFLLLFLAVVVACTVLGISVHSDAARTSYVQHHGIRANGTIDSVVNTEHCSKGGCHYTSAILVTLSPAVDGVHTTVVHYPDSLHASRGEQFTVLVDPKQPDYAEFPGAPFETGTWILLAIIAVFFAALAVLDGLVLRHELTHRREHRAQLA